MPEQTIYDEVLAERERAHAKHGDTSMESFPIDDMNRLAILTEEVGEVAKEFNEARHHRSVVDLVALRAELVQVAAMAVAWADAITGGSLQVAEPIAGRCEHAMAREFGSDLQWCVKCGREERIA